jgi:hypothetical protein
LSDYKKKEEGGILYQQPRLLGQDTQGTASHFVIELSPALLNFSIAQIHEF